jgi:hypothetical protein
MKKKIYKKALKMFIAEIGDCTMCPLCKENASGCGISSNFNDSDCVAIMIHYWLQKAWVEVYK